MSYRAEVPFSIAGIPCLIGVTSFYRQPPSRLPAHLCDSSDDYYGYTEIDFEILDRKGYRAQWLEKKGFDKSEVESAVCEYFSEGG